MVFLKFIASSRHLESLCAKFQPRQRTLEQARWKHVVKTIVDEEQIRLVPNAMHPACSIEIAEQDSVNADVSTRDPVQASVGLVSHHKIVLAQDCLELAEREATKAGFDESKVDVGVPRNRSSVSQGSKQRAVSQEVVHVHAVESEGQVASCLSHRFKLCRWSGTTQADKVAAEFVRPFEPGDVPDVHVEVE